jgi:hypothetical protein
MADETTTAGQVERWVRAGASIIAPATALSALLFYFGYVSARSQYEYFGVDVDTIGLGTQDYIMRSPQPLLMPLLTLTIIGFGTVALHTITRRRIAAAANTGRIQLLARGIVAAGLAVLGAGLVLLAIYPHVRDWALYDLVTPLLVTLGTALAGYGSRVLRLVGNAPESPPRPLLHRASGLLVYVVIAAGIFWTTATVAQWTGRGLAQYQARNLDHLPSVILDTKERLYLRSPGIDESVLPAAEGQTFHYRYRRLRLLIHGHDRMFLVPDKWSASNSTLIVTVDDSIRVQFQFLNQQP